MGLNDGKRRVSSSISHLNRPLIYINCVIDSDRSEECIDFTIYVFLYFSSLNNFFTQNLFDFRHRFPDNGEAPTKTGTYTSITRFLYIRFYFFLSVKNNRKDMKFTQNINVRPLKTWTNFENILSYSYSVTCLNGQYFKVPAKMTDYY